MRSADGRYDIRLLDYRDITHPEAGGAELYLHEVFRRLAQRGHRVRLLSASYPGAPPTGEQDGVQVERRGGRSSFNFRALAACRRWSRTGDGQVVVENLCKIPYFTRRLGGGIPSLTIVHHLFGDVVFQEANVLAAAYVRSYERLLPFGYRGARLVVVSETTRQDLEERGIRAGPVEVVYNGVDTDLFRPWGESATGTPRLLYLGRLKRYKRIDLLLRAAARLREDWPELEVVVVGRGDNLPTLQTLAADLGLGRAAHFPGYVSTEEKLRWLHSARALVYPSPKEGWGIAAIEASACGIPVVASDSPGLREAVRHEDTGLLVPHGDLDALVGALRRLLSDASLCRRLGQGGVRWASRFSWDLAADRIERNLAAVIEEGMR
jgi:glycosyltransferase involved in cell wall biosynthesis